MRKIFLIAVFFAVTKIVIAQSVYTYSIADIDGNSKSLSSYSGKKILLVTLSVVQNERNEKILQQLDSLAEKHSSTLTIIAIPSYEDGYTAADKDRLKEWHRKKLSSAVILTEGMYTRKTSDSRQHPLFTWLTDKDKNGHFNKDVTGPENKFIIWPDGRLAAVLSAGTGLDSRTMNNLL